MLQKCKMAVIFTENVEESFKSERHVVDDAAVMGGSLVVH